MSLTQSNLREVEKVIRYPKNLQDKVISSRYKGGVIGQNPLPFTFLERIEEHLVIFYNVNGDFCAPLLNQTNFKSEDSNVNILVGLILYSN